MTRYGEIVRTRYASLARGFTFLVWQEGRTRETLQDEQVREQQIRDLEDLLVKLKAASAKMYQSQPRATPQQKASLALFLISRMA